MQALQDNNLGDRLSLKATGRTLSIDSLPTGGNFDGVLVGVVDSSGKEVYKEAFPRGRRILFTPDVYVSGEYGMRLYAGPARDNMYHSWFGGVSGIPLLFNGRKWSFREAPFTLGNTSFVRNLPVSRAFLDDCLESTSEIQSNNVSIRSVAARIRQGRIFSESILLGVNDWVASNISYDLDSLVNDRYMDEDVSAVTILRRRRGVCCGYHNLVSALLRACGIPTLGIVCYTLGRGSKGWWYDGNNMDQETNHIMTAAFVSKRWRLMDVTWNSDLEYRNGRAYSRSGLGSSRTYCDASIPFISLTHRFDDYEL